ncbi:Rho termination factor [Roseovarius spongiae]|uniref:Rho termination factor n=1 Tax=Roseovarius spongiae TaxID=2320272 RepID=A0A3A8B374_9RHOB|nr:Rho termination factor N-terminal domain-containing protein [Roseovarius spongiae]RKF14912.1 Rho termination factor [Roseovarius spongiae]
MAKSQNPSIKDEDTYESLREDGASKEKAARIANAQANDSMKPSKKGGGNPPYEEWTRDDLYERAQEIGIDGRSDMTKDELIEALRTH